MPTQIIDNFDLNTAKPLDNRLVVGPNAFYTTKDSITYKYEGMRVWDLNDGVPYVWSGTTFSSENNLSVTGNGTQNYLAKFGSATNVILNSQIIDDGTNVGIGIPSPTEKLHVLGKIKSTVGFVGNGSLLTALNATEITTGTMNIGRLQGGSVNWILTADTASSATYKDPTSITVGKANQLSTVRSLWGQNFDGTQDVVGNMTINGQLNRAMSIGLLSGGINSSGTKIATVSFQVSASANKTLIIPTTVSNSDTFAFLSTTQTFTAAQTISGSSGTMLTVNRSSNGNNYTFFSTTGANNVGIFFQNSGSARSLYMDGSGNLITGGNAPYTSGFNNIKISASGISMVKNTTQYSWNINGLTADKYVSDFSGNATTGVSNLPSETYDRILYAFHGSSGSTHILIAIETTTDTFETVNRSAPGGYSGVMAIIPAGKRFRIFLDCETPNVNNNTSFKLYKFGL